MSPSWRSDDDDPLSLSLSLFHFNVRPIRSRAGDWREEEREEKEEAWEKKGEGGKRGEEKLRFEKKMSKLVHVCTEFAKLAV